MKALSGREHEVLIKVEGQDYLLTEEEYNGLGNNNRLTRQSIGFSINAKTRHITNNGHWKMSFA